MDSEFQGICANCLYACNCLYRLQTKQPILFCEEYFFEKRSSTVVASQDPEGDNPPKSLCENCANHNKCHLTKPPGGVWHCEEFC